jgi:hypothetical protein
MTVAASVAVLFVSLAPARAPVGTAASQRSSIDLGTRCAFDPEAAAGST